MSKKNLTKKALVSSAIALLLCVTMLLGTTYAWFTDTATTGISIIQSGTLDVDIVDEGGSSLEGETLDFYVAGNDGSSAEPQILWEPGATYYLESFKIMNRGDLALKFQLIIDGLVGDAKLLEAIEWGIIENYDYESDPFDVEGYEFINLEDYVGYLLPGNTTGNAMTLVAHMREDAGNEYQNLTAEGLDITVVATQWTHESDSFDNQYDEGADYVANFATGTHTLNNEYFVATGNETVALTVENPGTIVNIMNGTYKGSVADENVFNCAVYAKSGAEVNIYGGNFDGGAGGAAVNANGAEVNIYGGFFEATPYNGTYFVLNLQDNQNGDINVYGGTFVNFDPSNANTEPGDGTVSFVADGYTVVEEQHGTDTWYIVVPGEEVGTADELIAAVEAGRPVTLTDDIEIEARIAVNCDLVIYGNGHTITTNNSAYNSPALFVREATDPKIIISGLTLEDDMGVGVSVYNCIGTVNMVITDSIIDFEGAHYGIWVAGNPDADAINVNVENTNITGYCAFWTHSSNTTANFTNCELTGYNKWDGQEANNFATIVVQDVDNTNLTFNNCKIDAVDNGTAVEYHLFDRSGDANVAWNNCTFYHDGNPVDSVEAAIAE